MRLTSDFLPRVLKLHLVSAAYGGVLASLNWSRTVEYTRTTGLKGESHDVIQVALLISVSVALYLLYRCVRMARGYLEQGIAVGPGRWVESWSVILYTLPLLWHQATTSTWIEADGATAFETAGYGAGLSGWVFCFAIADLLLFQILLRLLEVEYRREPRLPRSLCIPIPPGLG